MGLEDEIKKFVKTSTVTLLSRYQRYQDIRKKKHETPAKRHVKNSRLTVKTVGEKSEVEDGESCRNAEKRRWERASHVHPWKKLHFFHPKMKVWFKMIFPSQSLWIFEVPAVHFPSPSSGDFEITCAGPRKSSLILGIHGLIFSDKRNS